METVCFVTMPVKLAMVALNRNVLVVSLASSSLLIAHAPVSATTGFLKITLVVLARVVIPHVKDVWEVLKLTVGSALMVRLKYKLCLIFYT